MQKYNKLCKTPNFFKKNPLSHTSLWSNKIDSSSHHGKLPISISLGLILQAIYLLLC